MKVLQINPVSGIRSTGRICLEVAKLLEKRGDECLILYGREHAGQEAEKRSNNRGIPGALFPHTLARTLRTVEIYLPDSGTSATYHRILDKA